MDEELQLTSELRQVIDEAETLEGAREEDARVAALIEEDDILNHRVVAQDEALELAQELVTEVDELLGQVHRGDAPALDVVSRTEAICAALRTKLQAVRP